MNAEHPGRFLWLPRLVLFGAWATLVLVWRRGCYFGFPILSELKHDEWQFMAVLVLVPGAVLLLGAPLKLYVTALVCTLLLGGGLAESVCSLQERQFVARCEQSSGSCLIDAYRFGGTMGGRMLFIRGTDGSEQYMGQD